MLSLLLACTPAEHPPSIVLISLDTLRADRVGALGNPDGLTPNLDQLAAEGSIFTAAYSQAPETLFSHAALLTSRYPSELGRMSYSEALPTQIPTLPEVLSVYGYRTGAAVGGVHLTAAYGFDRGFDRFAQPTGEPGSFFHTLPLALEWLDSLDGEKPFMLLVHSYDTHSRYLKPPPFGYALADQDYDGAGQRVVQQKGATERVYAGRLLLDASLEVVMPIHALRLQEHGQWPLPPGWSRLKKRKLTDRDFDHVRSVYDGAVAYADAWVGLLMTGLEERGLLEHTVVVAFSDHGEHLGEEGIIGHRYFLDDTALQVPLIVRLPGGARGGQRIDTPVGLIDLAPTLLEAAGATPPAGQQGRSLWGALHGQPLPAQEAIFSEGMFGMISARTPAGRLTFSGVSAASPYLPALLATAPLSGPSFSGTLPEADRPAARQALQRWRATLSPAPSARAPISDAQREILQQNGYWGGR